MRTAQPLMERLNDWQTRFASQSNANNSTRGQQVDNTAPLQLASHYIRTLIIRSIYRPFSTFNARTSSSQNNTSSPGPTETEKEAYTHYRVAAKSAANRFTDFAREISDRQIRAFWPFCKRTSHRNLSSHHSTHAANVNLLQGAPAHGRPCATSGSSCTRRRLRTRSATSAGPGWTRRGICFGCGLGRSRRCSLRC